MEWERLFTSIKGVLIVLGENAGKLVGASAVWAIGDGRQLAALQVTRAQERALRSRLFSHNYVFVSPAQFLDYLGKIMLEGRVARPQDLQGLGELTVAKLCKVRKTKEG